MTSEDRCDDFGMLVVMIGWQACPQRMGLSSVEAGIQIQRLSHVSKSMI